MEDGWLDAVIVGAGITGLALSHALAARGAGHVVLEAGDEPGGAIRTRVVDGRVLEEGPQRTRLTPGVQRLVRTLGLESELLVAPADLPLWMYARGRLRRAPLSLRELLTTDLLGAAAKTRVLLEPFTRPARNGESVADVFVRRFGRRAYVELLGPLFGGLYASDPADMPARHALLPALRELGAERSAVVALLRRGGGAARTPAISFQRGLRTLTDALHDAVRPHVRLRTAARALRRDGDGWIVETDDATLRTRHVVLTVPAGAAAALLRDAAPDAAARLDRLRYNTIAIAYLDAPPARPGLGYQVAFGESLETRGVTFNHSLFGRANLYTAFLGGAKNPALPALDDRAIADTAARELHETLRVVARPIDVARAWIPAWDRSWDALDGLTLPPGLHLAANYESRVGIPGRLAKAERMASDIEQVRPPPPNGRTA